MSSLSKIKVKKHRLLRLLLFAAITVFILFYVLDFGKAIILKSVYPIKYQSIVEAQSERFGIDKYLVYAVIKTESRFKENAVSSSGAKGLMQLMDKTAEECNKKGGFGFNLPEDIYSPEKNITLGCYYLNKLLKIYNGDISLAIAAYNGGTANVKKWLSDGELSDGDGGLIDIPFAETKGYVDKVIYSYEKYKKIYEED